MAKNAIYTVPFRRKREGRTHYKRRLELLKSSQTRVIIRRTNTSILLQAINYLPDGDKVICTFNSKKLSTYGWNYSTKSIPAAYLAGLAFGKLALSKGVKSAILDLGLQTPVKGSRLYAALKGVVDAGLKIPCSEDIFPSMDRIEGKHIASYDAKRKVDPAKLPAAFTAVKNKLGDSNGK